MTRAAVTEPETARGSARQNPILIEHAPRVLRRRRRRRRRPADRRAAAAEEERTGRRGRRRSPPRRAPVARNGRAPPRDRTPPETRDAARVVRGVRRVGVFGVFVAVGPPAALVLVLRDEPARRVSLLVPAPESVARASFPFGTVPPVAAGYAADASRGIGGGALGGRVPENQRRGPTRGRRIAIPAGIAGVRPEASETSEPDPEAAGYADAEAPAQNLLVLRPPPGGVRRDAASPGPADSPRPAASARPAPGAAAAAAVEPVEPLVVPERGPERARLRHAIRTHLVRVRGAPRVDDVEMLPPVRHRELPAPAVREPADAVELKPPRVKPARRPGRVLRHHGDQRGVLPLARRRSSVVGTSPGGKPPIAAAAKAA